MLNVTVYHNAESRFMPYEDGQQLVAVALHWLPAPTSADAQAFAEWAYHAFNADLDMLEPARGRGDGELTFLAACVYRLLGHRSLSVGDVIEVDTGPASQWLACENAGWRRITPPSNASGQPLSAATVYQRLVEQRRTSRTSSPSASEPTGNVNAGRAPVTPPRTGVSCQLNAPDQRTAVAEEPVSVVRALLNLSTAHLPEHLGTGGLDAAPALSPTAPTTAG